MMLIRPSYEERLKKKHGVNYIPGVNITKEDACWTPEENQFFVGCGSSHGRPSEIVRSITRCEFLLFHR